MKVQWIPVVLTLAIFGPLGPFNPTWVPYGSFVAKSAGNPNWDAYAGEVGSTYDRAANPPQTIGTASYDPYAPLPSVAPATTSGGATMAAPPR
ncbi:MAG TPA: hypothetical protein VG501_01960 [Rhizomicrobium sp.]|nr:hypothetical protein [Rhizomicrobium sp.]